jgi:hypothetical protein
MNLIDISQQILAIYAILLIVLGTVFCLTGAVVSFKSKSNYTLIAYFCLASTFTLYTWNLDTIASAYRGISFQNLNIFTCRIGNFVQHTALQTSSWIMVPLFLRDAALSTKNNNFF